MGVRFPSVSSNTILNSPIVTSAETVVVTTPPLNLALDFAQILLFWYIVLTVGAAGNAIIPRLRRGTTIAGTLVNVAFNQTAVAGNIVASSGSYADTPGAVAGQQYSLTMQVNAATANSTVQDVSLIAFAL